MQKYVGYAGVIRMSQSINKDSSSFATYLSKLCYHRCVNNFYSKLKVWRSSGFLLLICVDDHEAHLDICNKQKCEN